MKLVLKSSAWDIQFFEDIDLIVEQFFKGIKTINVTSGKTEKYHATRREYYEKIYPLKQDNILLALRKYEYILDIFDVRDLKLLHSIKYWNYFEYSDKEAVVDLVNKDIYILLYEEDIQKSVFIKIDLEKLRAKEILHLSKFYAFAISWIPSARDFLVSGIEFYEKNTLFRKAGKYKGIWSKEEQNEILYPQANRIGRILEKVGVMEDENILYYTGRNTGVYSYASNQCLIRKAEEVAFSENGKYIAYIKGKNLYIVLYKTGQIVDKQSIEYSFIFFLGFKNDDKYVYFRNENEIFVYDYLK